MSRVQSLTGEFARRGFDSATSAVKVWERWTARAGAEPTVELTAFDVAADPDQALDSLDRMAAAAPALVDNILADAAWLDRLIRVLGGSSVLAQTLIRHPEKADVLRNEAGARGADGWLEFFREATEVEPGRVVHGEEDKLRVANRVALIEIAGRDLSAEDSTLIVDDIAAELSYVADAVLEQSLAYARDEVPGSDKARIAVLALGKTGAGELNYISDVDVIYVAEPADGVATDEAMSIATRVAAAQARICSAHTSEGTIWQVDAALRPEGKAGPLVRTLASYRTYYEKWAKNWEFQAMLKARPAAGDRDLGHEFVDLIAPHVWSAGERPDFVAEARAMRDRVISLIPPKQVDYEIKLSQGGLRDTEFSVQLLQLVHGRADERLRHRGTFGALHALVENGYIGRADGAEMDEAYRFQRTLEHRVQLRRLRRTHLVPDDESALRQVARSLGLSSEKLMQTWR
ncbi:MAG TPA: bifunctional glutamine-synthetase adenylyltransferase/deadenyltransferase, partial [Tessaracoccus flavescens]|nr:bifunctional glutamine-synthetase adenylyltransferase/deadenyltransferase [Tessaracoccus flavescens]